jgi:hypothetical protein
MGWLQRAREKLQKSRWSLPAQVFTRDLDSPLTLKTQKLQIIVGTRKADERGEERKQEFSFGPLKEETPISINHLLMQD